MSALICCCGVCDMTAFFLPLFLLAATAAPALAVGSNAVLAADFTGSPVTIRGVAEPFFFGFGISHSQVEDQIVDDWIRWGRSGRIAAWLNDPRPEERVQFWSRPEVSLRSVTDAACSDDMNTAPSPSFPSSVIGL